MNHDQAVLVQLLAAFQDAVDMLARIGRGESFRAMDYQARMIGFHHTAKKVREHLAGEPEVRCPDCGEAGERKGHQGCQYPQH